MSSIQFLKIYAQVASSSHATMYGYTYSEKVLYNFFSGEVEWNEQKCKNGYWCSALFFLSHWLSPISP
jgi:hypothetical protein